MGDRLLDVEPIAGAMGAEIRGVDLSRPLDDATFRQIHATILDYGVIFFRAQHITPEQQLMFAGRFGTVHFHPHMPCLPGHPGIIEIVKKEEDTVAFGGNWHTDQMFTPTPARYTLLYAKQIPPVGGDTMFANLYLAYDALSAGMKAMLAGLRTVNLYDKKKPRPQAMAPTAPDEDPLPALHPLIRVHPETGRKALYLSSATITRHIDGMTLEESQPLLSYLMMHATRQEFTCRFRWSVGALAMWDNRRALHYPINDYNGYRRVMHRITIEGDPTS